MGYNTQNRENIVNNIAITLYADRWLLDFLWSLHRKIYKCQINLLYN